MIYLVLIFKARRQLRYFEVFSALELPELNQKIFELAASDDFELQSAVIQALSNNKDKAIRQLALLLCNQYDPISLQIILRLFVHNYQSGDHLIIDKMLTRLDNEIDIHNSCSTLIDICGKHFEPALLTCLLWVYECSPCTVCREEAVKLMVQHELLPQKLQEKCQFDCIENIRNLVKEYRTKTGTT